MHVTLREFMTIHLNYALNPLYPHRETTNNDRGHVSLFCI